MSLRAERLEVTDYFQWQELAYQRRWTDGLPVVPPTPELVEEMIAYVGRDPEEVIGEVPPRYGVATVEALAINSVMAGCKPEYFPVVLAAMELMLEPDFNLHGIQTTTHNNEPLVIISGPAVKELEVNTGHGVFGNGARANGTIGRAIKLILWNVGGSYPGEPDKTTFAHPGKWTYCIGESLEDNPWEPLHVDFGLPAEASAVTVISVEAPHNVHSYGDAERVLNSIAAGVTSPGSNNYNSMGQTLIVIGPEPARILAEAGLSKREVREIVWERAKVPLRELRKLTWVDEYARQSWPDWLDLNNDDEMVPPVCRPEDLIVMVAGGAGKFTAICPGWGYHGGFARSKELKLPVR
jgi:hypothetical protein